MPSSGRGGASAAARAAATAAASALGLLAVLGLGVAPVVAGCLLGGGCGFLLGGFAGGLLGLLLRAALGLFLELGGDRRVVLGAQVDLFERGAARLRPVGLELLLALEGLDLLDGDVELVRDPGVCTTLSHPPTDLVKLRTQGPATHERPVG